MLHFKKTLFIASLTISLAACTTNSEPQTSPIAPTDSSTISPASSPSPAPDNLNSADLNLLQVSSPNGLTTTGISLIEKTNNSNSNWRWGLGPETRLSFNLPKTQPLELVFSFGNRINGQDVTVEVNGVTVEKIVDIKPNDTIKRNAEFQGVAGLNTVVFRYGSWNKNQVTFAPNDPRPMAIMFTELAIEQK